TLARQIKRCGALPRYRAWQKILRTPVENIIRELRREDSRVQQRNSCHPFGNALTIYEELYLEFAPQLTGMARDPSQKVRLALALANETPPNAFWLLYGDADHTVASSASRAYSLPLGYYLDDGVKIFNRKKPTRRLVKSLTESENPFLRHIAAKSPYVTASDLQRLSSDHNPYVAEAAAHRLAIREYYHGGLSPAELDPRCESTVR
ncbi:MAG: hypothetical protein EBY32_11180, partial [Proteobacteria bacterium]|nr:hypothetical protein [Pseudomonadota bacterium]